MKRCRLVLAVLFPALVAVVPSHAKEIMIGLITPLSGDVKTYGESVRNSFLIAVEEATPRLGYKKSRENPHAHPDGHEPEGHRGGREAEGLHVPELLHRPLPGDGDGQILARDAEEKTRRDPVRRVERLLERDRRSVPRRLPETGRDDGGLRSIREGRRGLLRAAHKGKGFRGGRDVPAGLLQQGRPDRQAGAGEGAEGSAGRTGRVGLPRPGEGRRERDRGRLLLQPLLSGRPAAGGRGVGEEVQGEARAGSRRPRDAGV